MDTEVLTERGVGGLQQSERFGLDAVVDKDPGVRGPQGLRVEGPSRPDSEVQHRSGEGIDRVGPLGLDTVADAAEVEGGGASDEGGTSTG